MATLKEAAGTRGPFTDGDWILSDNMSEDGTIGVIQLKHVGVGDFLRKEFQFITEKIFKELGCTEVLPGDVLISRMADPLARACIVPPLPFRVVTAVDVTILRVDDVLNTYRVWLRYELFRGRVSDANFQASEANLTDFVKARSNTKPHLSGLM
jgi:type I restriction enzyme S subunit